MKKASDARHLQRVAWFKLLYSYSFAGIGDEEIEAIIEQLPTIDAKIQAVAPQRSIENMDKTNIAMLRLGVFELIEGKNKPAVIIDEMVEIAKRYGSESSAPLVNAVLDTIAKSL